MRRRRAGAFSLLLLLGAMPCTIAPAAPLPTHAVVEVHPELLQVLARAAEYPFPVVDYTGSDARTVLPAKGRWGAGEYGHLKRLNLFLERPDDIAVRFEAQPVGPGQTRPIARLTIMLRGPAEAEWWSKLPLQGEWGMVRSFREQIGLLVRTTARLVVSKGDTGDVRVALAFDRVTGGNIELDVRHCPPWLDRTIESRFDVAKQVNLYLAEQMTERTQLDLPPLTVPYLAKPLVIEDLRPAVRDGVLRVEMTLGSR